MPDNANLLFDALDTFQNGINSDIAPILLPKQTLAWLVNGSVRGGFVKPRPPVVRRTITFPSQEVQTAIQFGLFQGAGYYRPDFGPQQLIAQISGRLFSFTLNAAGEFTVAEITIPGDPNSATATQVWMNQAEKWLIITDGTTALPIFWDGVAARRSAGPSVQLGLVTAVSDSTPDIAQTIQFTLVSPWTRPFGETVLFNGEYWQTIGTSATPSFDVILTNRSATVGGTVPSGSDIVVKPQVLANIMADTTVTWGQNLTVPVSSTSSFVVGQTVYVTHLGVSNSCGLAVEAFSVVSIDSGASTVTVHPVGSSGCPIGVGTQTIWRLNLFNGSQDQFLVTGSAPDVIVGVTDAPFTVPAIGSDVNVTLVSPYSDTDNQAVWIGNDQYTIRSAGGVVGSTTLFMKSLTATTAIPAMPPNLPILSVPELPSGRMGAYGLGHQAMSLMDGTSFLYGDTVGGPSGSATYSYRDAVLKTTENTFQEGGGAFRIPNSGEIITSMRFAAVLDAAYGQGPLQLGTPSSIFTCAVPTDRSIWIAITNPILTQTLIGGGPLAQNSTIPANSDTLFRNTDGYGSMIFGRRDFQTTWGNTPIGSEVVRATREDNRDLLTYGNAVTFDNRLLTTSGPVSFASGVHHIGLLEINFDPVSSLRGKAPSIWESLWEGPNILQILSGVFGSVERCFFFGDTGSDILGQTSIGLFELLREDAPEHLDHGTDRISWSFETTPIFRPTERKANFPLTRLLNGKVYLRDVLDTVHLKVEYRPDFSPAWVLWHEVDVAPADSPPAIGLGEPSAVPCVSGQPARVGRFFQLRVTITGYCVFTSGQFVAALEPAVVFPPPAC